MRAAGLPVVSGDAGEAQEPARRIPRRLLASEHPGSRTGEPGGTLDPPLWQQGEDGSSERDHALAFLRMVERLFLTIIVLLTLVGAAIEVASTYRVRSIDLADILLPFL